MTPSDIAIILEEIRPIRENTDSTSSAVATLQEQMGQVKKVVDRLDVAVFGNGKPGLRYNVDENHKRLTIIEGRCAYEANLQIDDRLQKIETSITDANKARDERHKAEESERRKFKYGVYALIVTTVVDVLLRLIFG